MNISVVRELDSKKKHQDGKKKVLLRRQKEGAIEAIKK
jgi:hypothetical protein